MTDFDSRPSAPRLATLALAALLPAACAVPQPPSPSANPFAGAWATAERQQIVAHGEAVGQMLF